MPLLALNSGSPSSLITPGVTRFMSEDVEQLAATDCAAEARKPFGPAHIAREHLKV